MTIYFMIFGLIIFYLTTVIYVMAEKKALKRSAKKMILHQLSTMNNSGENDFILKGIGQKQTQLYDSTRMLVNLSSGFYTISDISIYTKISDENKWVRLYIGDDQVLRSHLIEDASVEKLNKSLQGHLFKSGWNFFLSDETLSMFTNVSGENDKNHYFFKIEMGRQGIANIVSKKIFHLIGFSIVILVFVRILGYYFARKLAQPIEALSERAASVAKGDLSQIVPVTTSDELGQLADNFNKMIYGLREWERIKVIEFELEKGRQIQKEFLPGQIPKLPDWEIATFFRPAHQVSGDFYDVFSLPGGYLGLVIADVCDKGVGSALYMALFRSLIRVYSEQALSGNGDGVSHANERMSGADNGQIKGLKAVISTNNYIAQNHGDEGMFATLFFGIGQAIGPGVAGALADATGSFSPALLLAAGVAFLGGIGASLLR
jgi:HAMP domain-containing protein